MRERKKGGNPFGGSSSKDSEETALEEAPDVAGALDAIDEAEEAEKAAADAREQALAREKERPRRGCCWSGR